MTPNQRHNLYGLLMDSFNRTVSNGMSICDWVEHMRDLGCVLYPSPKNMMLASMGRIITPDQHKVKSGDFFRVKTNSFGNIYVPKDLAFKVLVMEFFP